MSLEFSFYFICFCLKKILADNLNWLTMESKYLCLLSDVYSKMEMEDQAMSALQKAWSVQTR